jgi:hypothetical protein
MFIWNKWCQGPFFMLTINYYDYYIFDIEGISFEVL